MRYCQGSHTSTGDLGKTNRFRQAMKFWIGVEDDWPYGRVACSECDNVVFPMRDGRLKAHRARHAGQALFGTDPWIVVHPGAPSVVQDICETRGHDLTHEYRYHLHARIDGADVQLPGAVRMCRYCGKCT